jgi:hypothetical protein
MDGVSQYPVSAKTGISYEDYNRMGTERHEMRAAKFVPAFAANDAQFRRVILARCWRYVARGPMPENLKLADIDRKCTEKALNAEFGFETTTPAHQAKAARHMAIIQRCGGYASFCSAIAYRGWRLRWNSLAIAEEMGLTSEHVRQTLSRLVHIAEELGYETFATPHHSKGVPKHFAGVSRDGRVYGRPKPEPKPRVYQRPDVFLVGDKLQTAIIMRKEKKTLAEISAATGASTCKISTVLCRLGLGQMQTGFDAEKFNELRRSGKSIEEVGAAMGILPATLWAKMRWHRQRHGKDSIFTPERGGHHFPSKVNVEQARAMREQGKTFKDIGAVFGVTGSAVVYAMQKAGTYNPTPVGRPQKIDIEQAKALRAQGKTLEEIGNALGVHFSTVRHALLDAARKAGLPIHLGQPSKVAAQ